MIERERFEMHFLEGLSSQDIAVTFHVERIVVDRRIEQIRARLRTRLGNLAQGRHDVPIPGDRQGRRAAHLSRTAQEHDDRERDSVAR